MTLVNQLFGGQLPKLWIYCNIFRDDGLSCCMVGLEAAGSASLQRTINLRGTILRNIFAREPMQITNHYAQTN